MRKAASPLLVAALLVVAALFTGRDSLSGPATWSPDGLFYQARVFELRGESHDQALSHAFQGPLGATLRREDPTRSGSPAWVAYNAQFYARRLSVPLAGAALQPIAGDRSLLDISLAGYVAAVLAVFGLLLLRFRLPVAAIGGLATAVLPALAYHSGFPLTDSWGVALETAALACALLALERSRRWLIPWALVIGVLSFTRDSLWIPILAAAFVAVTQRSRTGWWLVGTGVLAAAPAMVAVTVPLRELLGQMFTPGFQPAPDAGWGWILSQYPGAIVDLLQANGGFVRDGAWGSAAFFLIGLGALAVLGPARHRDPATSLALGGAVAGILYVLVVPIFSALRLELVWVPFAAFGIALVAERLAQRISLPSPSSRLSHRPLPSRLSSSE